MPIDPRISLGVQQLQIADPLAQYGQVQNILAAQQQRQTAGIQNELAQAQLGQVRTSIREVQEAQDFIAQVMAEAKKNNAPTSDPMDAAMQMLRHPNPKVRDAGKNLFDANQTLLAYQQEKGFADYNRPKPAFMPTATITPGALGSGTFDPDAPVAEPMMSQTQKAAAITGTNLPPVSAPTNQLAPAAAAPVQTNALATPSKADQILAEIVDLQTRFPRSEAAKNKIALLTKQWENASKTHVVGRNLVTSGGHKIFEAPQDITPSEIKRLTAERDALAPNDPKRQLYDQAIADIGSQAQLARQRLDFDIQNAGSTRNIANQRLAFDQAKFAWEKSNPGFTIQQAEDGSIVGVNNRTLQAYPVSLNATPPPAPAPFGSKPPPGGAGKRGAVTTEEQPATQPLGQPLKGKSGGLTEGQGNAAMFGSAMAQAQQVFDKVEKEGTTTGAVATNLAQGIVKYVPLGVGDKLVNDIYALAVNDPTKLFGPDVNQQKLGQAQLAFSIAYLRKTSGAMFGPSEVANTIMEYFPAIGESASVVKQKSASRKRAIAGMKMSAGREGAKFIEQYESPSDGTSSTSAADPLNLFPAKKP
jgi:hypothetical protein